MSWKIKGMKIGSNMITSKDIVLQRSKLRECVSDQVSDEVARRILDDMLEIRTHSMIAMININKAYENRESYSITGVSQ